MKMGLFSLTLTVALVLIMGQVGSSSKYNEGKRNRVRLKQQNIKQRTVLPIKVPKTYATSKVHKKFENSVQNVQFLKTPKIRVNFEQSSRLSKVLQNSKQKTQSREIKNWISSSNNNKLPKELPKVPKPVHRVMGASIPYMAVHAMVPKVQITTARSVVVTQSVATTTANVYLSLLKKLQDEIVILRTCNTKLELKVADLENKLETCHKKEESVSDQLMFVTSEKNRFHTQSLRFQSRTLELERKLTDMENDCKAENSKLIEENKNLSNQLSRFLDEEKCAELTSKAVTCSHRNVNISCCSMYCETLKESYDKCVADLNTAKFCYSTLYSNEIELTNCESKLNRKNLEINNCNSRIDELTQQFDSCNNKEIVLQLNECLSKANVSQYYEKLKVCQSDLLEKTLKADACNNTVNRYNSLYLTCKYDLLDANKNLNFCNGNSQNLQDSFKIYEDKFQDYESNMVDCYNKLKDLNITLQSCQMNLSGKTSNKKPSKVRLKSANSESTQTGPEYAEKGLRELSLNTNVHLLDKCAENSTVLASELAACRASLANKTELYDSCTALLEPRIKITARNEACMSVMSAVKVQCAAQIQGLEIKTLKSGAYYVHFNPENLTTWLEALDFCVSRGLRLLQLNDRREEETLTAELRRMNVPSSASLWFSPTNVGQPDTRASAGLDSAATNLPWAAGEPSEGPGDMKLCAALRLGENGTLAVDLNCTSRQAGFICEMTGPCATILRSISDFT